MVEVVQGVKVVEKVEWGDQLENLNVWWGKSKYMIGRKQNKIWEMVGRKKKDEGKSKNIRDVTGGERNQA